MLSFHNLFLECHDARVFSKGQNHNLLSKIFFSDAKTNEIAKPGRYFLIGEKGTGKTIISQYYANIKKETNSSIIDFSEIDFETFRSMKDDGLLKYIQYDQIWKVVLLTIAAEVTLRNEPAFRQFLGIQKLKELIDLFYSSKFVPQLPVALQILTNIEAAAGLSNEQFAQLRAQYGQSITENSNIIQSPLNSLLRDFEEAFKRARISENHTIFVDGIDLKPEQISFDHFIIILRGFARAALSLNEGIFSEMKGKKKIKFVLLLRPDIFDQLNMQNQSAKVSDNSVVLNWDTTAELYRSSHLFALCDQFLSSQSGPILSRGAGWDHYVDSNVNYTITSSSRNDSFREFLRVSWFRPRDIIRTLRICQERMDEKSNFVTRELFEASRKDFSDYLFGEVKDFSRFYFSDKTFNMIERFFSELSKENKFTYDTFMQAHGRFVAKIKSSPVKEQLDPRVESPDDFLQILYTSNIICWREENRFGKIEDHWAFRERTPAQLEPKVGLYENYAVHYGLRRTLRLKDQHITGVSTERS